MFAETGLVVTPFLPGDSLLFATGALAGARGPESLAARLLLLISRRSSGTRVNYAVGKYIGPRAFTATDTTEPVRTGC